MSTCRRVTSARMSSTLKISTSSASSIWLSLASTASFRMRNSSSGLAVSELKPIMRKPAFSPLKKRTW